MIFHNDKAFFTIGKEVWAKRGRHKAKVLVETISKVGTKEVMVFINMLDEIQVEEEQVWLCLMPSSKTYSSSCNSLEEAPCECLCPSQNKNKH